MSSPLATTSPPAFSWHPKLTPYRLAFIGVTGGLCVTKAVLVANNKVASSITIEWITGVVVALSFQFLGACEYQDDLPVYIDWMFSYDCLNVLKIVLQPGGDSQPAQTQPEHPANANSTPNLPPIVTAYRLLFSITVSIIGIVKMMCSYLGLSTTMNTFDWIMAVPLTLGLYYIGLYEERQCSVPRMLFDVSYSSKVRWSLKTGPYYIVGLTLCCGWIYFGLDILRRSIIDFHLAASETVTMWKVLTNYLGLVGAIAISLGVIESGVLGGLIILWPIIKMLSGQYSNLIKKYTLHLAAFIACLITGVVFAILFLLFLPTAPLWFSSEDDSLFARVVLLPCVFIYFILISVTISVAAFLVAVEVAMNPPKN